MVLESAAKEPSMDELHYLEPKYQFLKFYFEIHINILVNYVLHLSLIVYVWDFGKFYYVGLVVIENDFPCLFVSIYSLTDNFMSCRPNNWLTQ